MGGYSLLKNVFPNFKNTETNNKLFVQDESTPSKQPIAYKNIEPKINQNQRLENVFYKPTRIPERETFGNSCEHIMYCDVCRIKLLSLIKNKRTFYDDIMDFLMYVICLLVLILLLENLKTLF